ncbi:MAG: hypothetical protein WA474_21885 [Candidatus Sulfotelmatobacter sp.]
MIGLPLEVTFPRIEGIRSRYCSRWDEGPAAVLGMSLLRLGICRPNDWSGSAVDFVERGFRRFCSRNRAADAKKVWVGDLRITDSLFELTEQERNQVEAESEGMADHLYLIGDYEAAASIPIGATLTRLEAEHSILPAAFYEVFTTNLYKWMRVYDYVDAQEHAEMWMEDLSDEESEASVYRKVDTEMPACIKAHAKTLKYRRAKKILQEIRPHTGVARELIRHLLEMDARGLGREHAWPGQLNEKDVPGIDDWLTDAENSRPGCLITWYENDAINACFDEDAQLMGENGPCQPNVALPIHLNKPAKELDEEVRRVFDHAGAMLLSLAAAAEVVEIIRDLYDEYLREHRLESGLPVEPGLAGVRDE